MSCYIMLGHTQIKYTHLQKAVKLSEITQQNSLAHCWCCHQQVTEFLNVI